MAITNDERVAELAKELSQMKPNEFVDMDNSKGSALDTVVVKTIVTTINAMFSDTVQLDLVIHDSGKRIIVLCKKIKP